MGNVCMRMESFNRVEQDVLYPAKVCAIMSCTRLMVSTLCEFFGFQSWGNFCERGKCLEERLSFGFLGHRVPCLHSYNCAG